MGANADIIRNLYDALGRGKVRAVLGSSDPKFR